MHGGARSPIRPRLTEDQKRTQHYLQSTHGMIPVHKRDLVKMRIPLGIAVIPFPKDAPSNPLTSSSRYSKMQHCRECRALASHRYIPCPDGSGWLCPVCNHKNAYSPHFVPLSESVQTKSGVWEAFAPAKEEEIEEGSIPIVRPIHHLIVLELSEASIETGIYNGVLDKLEQTVQTLDSGKFTVFIFNTGLHFPMVNKANKKFSMVYISDLDEPGFPLPEKTFFDLASEKELFLDYLKFLKTYKEKPPRSGLLSLIKAMDAFTAKQRIPVVIVSSQANIEPSSDFQEFASIRSFNPVTHYEIWTIKPEQYPPDYTGLSQLSMYLNSKVHICDAVQLNVLPGEIVSSLFDVKVTDIVILCKQSPAFKITDIHGCGYWRSENTFAVSAMGANDAVYFVLDYEMPQIKMSAPTIQFQVRYFDHLGRKVVRVMTMHFTLVDNMNSCAVNAYYDVVIATMMHQALGKAREFGSLDEFQRRLDEIRKSYIGDSFAKLFLMNCNRLEYDRVSCALKNSGSLIDWSGVSSTFGKCPVDVSLFVVPVCYSLNLYDMTTVSPAPLNGSTLLTGALYIKLPDRHGVVLLAGGEDVHKWTVAIQSPPLSDIIGQICQEKVVEILAPSTSSTHPLFVHIQKCLTINTKI